MFHLEDHAFARRKPIQRAGNLLSEFLPQQISFRIRSRSLFWLPVEEISGAAFGIFRHRRLIFAAAGAAAQVIKRHVRHDPV
jgi:hypothetical protein